MGNREHWIQTGCLNLPHSSLFPVLTHSPPSMSLARTLLLQAADSQWLANQMSRRAFARRAVRRFMPGEEVDAALEAARRLASLQLGSVVTQLGEGLTSLADAEAVRDHYLAVCDRIRRAGLATWISIKPTQLGLDLSPTACLDHLFRLAELVESIGSSLWIDMEDSRYVDRTLELYRRVRAKHQRVGVCLQSYLFRTPNDLATLLPIKPWIRLVKGAYAEPATVAYPAKRDSDLAYYDLALKLLDAAAKGDVLPVFGTHDLTLLNRIVAAAGERNVRDSAYEIHMLYGIRSADQRALAAGGHTVRTLISYGEAWFKWYMRRLAERPANVWFALKSMVGS